MMRLSRIGIAVTPTASSSTPLLHARRCVRYANIQETLKPIPGHSAGQMSILNEICCNPDAEEERRKPIFRLEVMPDATAAVEDNYLHAMHKWGYDSLTLFKKTNEDPGPWWNANASTLASNWSQVGDYANAGMWSGVWRYTYGIGEYNLRPYELRGRAWGRKDPNSGALDIRYGKHRASKPLQKLCFPHTAEHAQHHRVRNPANKDVKEISALHGKRILRELQYHLGQGLRFYMVDGVFGSDPATATAYRIITDNPTHAYFASMAAIRTFNYVARQEVTLVKRLSQSPIDEWGWRRPGVLIYHAPSYDFESPRIVEEFGGPRPKDMGLSNNRFIATEPYSIPMKCAMAGEPSCDALLDSTAMLCGRWGFYADDKGFLTVPGESIMSTDGHSLTLVITGSEAEADVLRTSPQLYGSRHHRIASGFLSRGWDVVSMPASANDVKPRPIDIVERDLQRVQRGLPTRMGLPHTVSHRYHGRRHVSEYGFKWPHNYTGDAATRAYAGGQLFKAPKADELAGHQPRPSRYSMKKIDVIIIGEGTDAAAAVISTLKERGILYADEEPLKKAMAAALKESNSVKVVPRADANTVLRKLARV